MIRKEFQVFTCRGIYFHVKRSAIGDMETQGFFIVGEAVDIHKIAEKTVGRR